MSEGDLRYPLGSIEQNLSSDRAIKSRSFYPTTKRIFDVAVTLLMAPCAILIVGICALLIRRDGERAFFCQPRVGKGGRIFKLWKLRTMAANAEERLQEHLAADPMARLEWDAKQKLRNDPRITPVGRYLRKYSIDEIPQLLNVFLGDMSLVGPRPMLPEQRQQYPGTAYFNLRPGLTGLWQISDRNSCTFVERAMHDTRYWGMMSFGVDLWILSQTPVVVLRGTGL